jgi:hypothetical protein
VAGGCEGGNEPLGSIICSEVLDQLRNCYLHKDCAAWSLRDFFISRSADVFIGRSAQKINTNIYGCKGKRAMELWRRGPW